MFLIKNLFVSTISNTPSNPEEELPILHDLNITLRPGEIHAIMGPNGAGKSTIAKVIAGDPHYTVTQGEILYRESNLLTLTPEERSKAKVFVSFQHPPEIPGLILKDFLHAAMQAHHMPLDNFEHRLRDVLNQIELPMAFAYRGLNDGFSGGEKRKVEILQLLLLNPDVIILDEIDSGLDVDALRCICKILNQWKTADKILLFITHYPRLLAEIVPDYVHVLLHGSIERSGDHTLAHLIDQQGYVQTKGIHVSF